MGMIYGGGILMPLILGLIMKGFGSKTPISLVMTGFGYSYSVFIPVTFLCCIPYFVSFEVTSDRAINSASLCRDSISWISDGDILGTA